MRKIKVVVLLVRRLQHGFTKNATVSPNLTVAHIVSASLSLRFVYLCLSSKLNLSHLNLFIVTTSEFSVY